MSKRRKDDLRAVIMSVAEAKTFVLRALDDAVYEFEALEKDISSYTASPKMMDRLEAARELLLARIREASL